MNSVRGDNVVFTKGLANRKNCRGTEISSVFPTLARICDRNPDVLSYSFEISQVTRLAERDESIVLRVSIVERCCVVVYATKREPLSWQIPLLAKARPLEVVPVEQAHSLTGR